MDEEMMDMMAMEEMMGGAPMDPGMGGGMPPMEDEGDSGVTNIPVPNFAVAAVLELIAMLEEEMAGGESMPF